MDLCGRIAHEWPAYTPPQVARLPFHQYRALRAILLRAHSPAEETDGNVEVIDVDATYGVGDKKGAT